jgi:hypothetical protein
MTNMKTTALFFICLICSLLVPAGNLVFAKHNQCHCCMCGSCSGGCWCPGQTTCCRFCRSEENESFQQSTLYRIDTLELRRTVYHQSLNILDSNIWEGTPVSVRGRRSGGHFVISLLDYALDHSKYGCHKSFLTL